MDSVGVSPLETHEYDRDNYNPRNYNRNIRRY